MATVLDTAAKALIDRPVIAVLTTLNADGSPHSTPVWLDRAGDELRVNTASGRVKDKNMRRDPRVSVCIVDPDDTGNVVAVAGLVEEITTEGADAHIDELSFKYTGSATFRAREPGRTRLLVTIRCVRRLGVVG